MLRNSILVNNTRINEYKKGRQENSIIIEFLKYINKDFNN